MRTVRGKEISFKKYLEMGRARKSFGDTPENDFAGDALRDQHFRDDFKTWDELELYLLVSKACPEALEAAQTLFKKWKAGL